MNICTVIDCEKTMGGGVGGQKTVLKIATAITTDKRILLFTVQERITKPIGNFTHNFFASTNIAMVGDKLGQLGFTN